MNNPLKIVFFLCISIFISGQLYSQNLLESSTFDTDLEGWTIEVPNGWEYSEDGKADAFDGLWGERQAIQSNSGPGAIAFKNFIPNSASIISPPYNLGFAETAYLKFNQYYRNFESNCRISVININTGQETSFSLNQNVLQHVETGANDVQIFNINEVLSQDGTDSEIQVRFNFAGTGYFWIIDDVQIWDDMPPSPLTKPIHHGDSLTHYGYPFDLDSADWPYVPEQVIVQFSPTASEADRQAIRDTLGAVKIDSCVCDVLELWRMTDDVIVDQNGNAIPDGGSIGILERVLGSGSSTKIDGVDVNYYTTSQYANPPIPPAPTPISPSDLINIPGAPSNAIRIAVLDTGIDFLQENETLSRYIYQKGSTPCYEEDPIGWNFVHDINNPMDDHSHGTHVAGIIAENLINNSPSDCNYHIIPYKTHDLHGISNLFDVTCATYQALEDDVSVINDSWGFYGTGSVILENAVQAALDENVLIVSAAGNDSLWLDTLNQYPACYTSENRLTVGSVEQMNTISAFSNYSSTWVDILAPGRNIRSTVPFFIDPSGLAEKTGTSMSTPAVSAAAAISYCEYPDFNHAKRRILDCADKQPGLSTFAVDGNILKFDVQCLTTETEDPTLPTLAPFEVFPNPTNGQIFLQANSPMNGIQVSVKTVEGREVTQVSMKDWHIGQEETLNLASLPQGMYLLHIQDGTSTWVSKIVKL